MAQERIPGQGSENFRRGIPYSNGDILTQGQFTDLVTSQRDLASVSLLSMSYNFPEQDGNAMRLHQHLLGLADGGTQISIGIDNSYANRIASGSDLPIWLAKKLYGKAMFKKKEDAYRDLQAHPNVELNFHGSEKPTRFPIQKIEHRKILLARSQPDAQADFACVFGFNINYQMDGTVIDSALYIDDPQSIAWLERAAVSDRFSPPVREKAGDFTFVTRELAHNPNHLADKEVKDVMDSAESQLLFCSQFMPDGTTFDGLVGAAQRGVDVNIVSNSPLTARQPVYRFLRSRSARKLGQEIERTGNMHFWVPQDPDMFFHMKALIADVDDPERRVALTGTDSMTNTMLQRLNLREVLVREDNPDHVAKLNQYITTNVFPIAGEFDFSQLGSQRRAAH